MCYVESGEESAGLKNIKAEKSGVIPMDCMMISVDSLSKMKVTEVKQRNIIDALQYAASYNRDKIKEQKEAISEFQDTIAGLTEQMDDYKNNHIEAARVLNKLRRHIGATTAAGQREIGEQYDGFSRVSDFVRDHCRTSD